MLVGELAEGHLWFRWAVMFPLTAPSAESDKEVAKHASSLPLLANENVQRTFVLSSWTFNPRFVKRS